ncbi:phage tail family protein [Cytobacillus oceanisediminis]|uniref:phage tail domain-containing protein n=1 Tax=Cytobacillus oceanisediminis TaxID=665099 RepID=UPI00203D7170|nr:phage tail domain-containing protein [Cytobacillus oceanisediminis]MCM3241332.1 phage tail family protein [Cytobacillus oceanisediminis]
MGVKLDGRDPREFGLIFLKDHFHPHTPEMRSKTLTIPGRPGAWDFGSEWDVRTFNLPFAIIEYNKLEMQRKIRAFVAFLLDSYGRPRVVKLTFDYDLDKYYSVKLASQISPERFFFAEQFEVPLVAYDPYAKSAVSSDKIIMESDTPLMSDILWDTGLSERRIIAPTTFSIVNNGTVALPFSYVVEGSGTNVKLSANGKTYTLGTFSNKIYEINGDMYTVKVNGVTDLTTTSGDFIELFPGSNVISVSGSNLNLTISESLTYKYI